MTQPHFLPATVVWILQWAEEHNWNICWTCSNLSNTLKLERGSRAMSFTLPADAKLSEWKAILTEWQKQNDPSQQQPHTL